MDSVGDVMLEMIGGFTSISREVTSVFVTFLVLIYNSGHRFFVQVHFRLSYSALQWWIMLSNVNRIV